jgi:hypothetical protein
LKKIGLFFAVVITTLKIVAGSITPTLIPGGEEGWTVTETLTLRLGLRVRDELMAEPTLDKKGMYLFREGMGLIEFSIETLDRNIGPFEDSDKAGYYDFFLIPDGKVALAIDPLSSWNDNVFSNPDGVFTGPSDWYVVVCNVAQGSHELLKTAKHHTLRAVPKVGNGPIVEVTIETRQVKK